MAEGIRRRHTRRCASRNGGKRCSCEGSWEAWIWLRREQRKVYKTFPSQDEAKLWRAERHKPAKQGAMRAPTRLTVEEAAWCWLVGADEGVIVDRSERTYKPSTLRGYRRALLLRVLPEFGAHRLVDLHRADVQAFANRLRAEGLSAGTVRNTLDPLRALFRHVIDEEEQLSVNPMAAVKLPRRSGGRDRIASAVEAAALLEALSADRALWATAFYAGLRRGEVRALRWVDVDLGRSEIRVERSWDQVEGPIDPKSETSARTVPILAVLRDYLVEHKLATGRDGEELVFGRTAELPFVPSTVRNRALAAWAAANKREAEQAEEEERKPALLERITLHECRHTFASTLIDAGANAKAIQTFLGHSTITMTYDTYGHLMPGSRDQTRELVDSYLEAAVAEARVEATAPQLRPSVPQSAAAQTGVPAVLPAEAEEPNPA